MKIVQRTEQSIVLKENNRALFFIGCALAVGGLIAVFYSLSEASVQPWWYGAVGVAIGVFITIATSVITITFDKSSNSILVQRKSLLQKHEDTYPLDQITALELRFDSIAARTNHSSLDTVKTMNVSVERPTYIYKLVAVLKDGREFFITTLSTNAAAQVSINVSGTMQVHAGIQDNIGPIIAEFLGVPYQKLGENPEAKFISTVAQI